MDKETRQGDAAHAHDGAGTDLPVAPRGPGQRRARANHYRSRAEELRTVAEDATLQETQRTLLSLADSYEHMASMLDDIP